MEHSLSGILWRLAAVMALVFANGFFVAAEFAIVKVRKTRIDQMIAEGHRGARAVRRAITDPDSYIAATQLGITMASLGLGWIGEPALAGLVQPALAFVPADIAETTAHSIAVAVAFAIVTSLHITLGELAPKTIALERSEATALIVVKPTELFMRACWPFIRVLNGMGRAIVNMIGLRGSGGHAMVHSEEELKMLVTASQEAGVLEEDEEQMLHRVFGFADLTAGQVMVPRTELAAVPADAAGDALLDHISRAGYPTLPVFKNDLDNIVGMLHAMDVLKALAAGNRNVTAASIAHDALTVPETMTADDLLTAMRKRGVREALVIDEYGGTAGLVTFEWLMERIVGVIGNTTGAGRILVHEDGSAEVDGLTLVPDVNEQFGLHIDEDTYTTVGGYVMGRIGRRARTGDTIEMEGRRMRVMAVDGLRIARVWISKPSVGSQQPERVGDDDH
jgi:CBS domain containing-hemolysin-like protein